MKPLYLSCWIGTRLTSFLGFGCRGFGLRHIPPRGGVLLLCNHQSYFDPIFVAQFLLRECHYLARDTLFRPAAFGRFLHTVNTIPVRRGTADLGAMKEAVRRLREGAPLIIFAEGTRTNDGSIGCFHDGPALVARRAGVPIVPVVIDGAFQAWPRKARLPRPHPIRVSFGRGVPAREVRSRQPAELTQELRERMVDMIEAMRAATA